MWAGTGPQPKPTGLVFMSSRNAGLREKPRTARLLLQSRSPSKSTKRASRADASGRKPLVRTALAGIGSVGLSGVDETASALKPIDLSASHSRSLSCTILTCVITAFEPSAMLLLGSSCSFSASRALSNSSQCQSRSAHARWSHGFVRLGRRAVTPLRFSRVTSSSTRVSCEPPTTRRPLPNEFRGLSP